MSSGVLDEQQINAGLIIQRAYKLYRLKKTVGFLRQRAPWLFTWIDGDSDEPGLDEIQKDIQDKQLQDALCMFMELLGSQKTSSLCHSKMILIGFMLTKYPGLSIPLGKNTEGDKKAASLSQDRQLSSLSSVLGTEFVQVCSMPSDWIHRIKFASAYGAFTHQFLVWKTKDRNDMIEFCLRNFSACLEHCNRIRVTISRSSHNTAARRELLEIYRKICEKNYMQLVRILGSARKGKQMLSCHLMKESFMAELKKNLGGAKQLEATEWVEDDDDTSIMRIRMALMLHRLGLKPCCPRPKSRFAEYDPETLTRWHGAIGVKANKMRKILDSEFICNEKNQVMWVPEFIEYTMDVFREITSPVRTDLRSEYVVHDAEFTLQCCEMNFYSVNKMVEWAVSVLRRLTMDRYREEREKSQKEILNLVKAEEYREAVMQLSDLLQNTRLDYCELKLERLLSTMDKSNLNAENTFGSSRVQSSSSNELVLFIRDLQKGKTHICKLSKWMRKLPTNVQQEGKFFPVYYRFVEFLLNMDNLKELAEPMEMLRIPIGELQIMISDMQKLFAVTQLVMSVSGDRYGVCSLQKQIMDVFNEGGPQEKQLTRIGEVIQKERVGMTDSELSLLEGVVDQALHGKGPLVQLAKTRLQTMLLACYDDDYEKMMNTKRNTKKEYFQMGIKDIVDRTLGIWTLSMRSYEPIYKSVLDMRTRLKSDLHEESHLADSALSEDYNIVDLRL